LLYKRVITGLIGAFLVFIIVYLGNFWLAAGLLLAIILGLREYARLICCFLPEIDIWPLFAGGVIIITGGAIGVEVGANFLGLSLLVAFFLILLFNLKYGPKDFFSRVSLTGFGLVYIPFTMGHILLLRGGIGFSGYDPLFLVWLPLIVTWITDISAFFVGTTLGKKRLAPNISPKKSIEGATGGAVFGISAAMGMAWYFSWPLIPVFLLGLILVIIGQAGDLAESCLKRNAGIKDSGNTLPGHGGFLDRMDSLIFTIPVAYYFIVCFF